MPSVIHLLSIASMSLAAHACLRDGPSLCLRADGCCGLPVVLSMKELSRSSFTFRGKVQTQHAASWSQEVMLRVCADAEEKDKGKKKLKPPRVVKAEAAKEMLRSTAKRAKAETALHLLHAVVAGTNGAHIGLAAADVTGIQVCGHACPPV